MTEASRSAETQPWHLWVSLVLAAIWLAMLLFGTGPLDQRVYEALYAGRSPGLVLAARFVTEVGQPTVLVIGGLIVAIWLWLKGQRPLAYSLTLVVLAGRVLLEAQKYAVGRVRPGLEPHLVTAKTYSFVSGHAGNSMVVFLALALALVPVGRWRPAATAGAMLLSFLIGLSRVMLGVHWPSDVIGGWAFGALWVLLTLRPAQQLLKVPLRR